MCVCVHMLFGCFSVKLRVRLRFNSLFVLVKVRVRK